MSLEPVLERIAVDSIATATVACLARFGFAFKDAELVPIPKPITTVSCGLNVIPLKPKPPEKPKKRVLRTAGIRRGGTCSCGKPAWSKAGKCRSCAQPKTRKKPTTDATVHPGALCRTPDCPRTSQRLGFCEPCLKAEQAKKEAVK